jgi:desulfoferrodoxin (superoxide reductase-like protein)
MKPQIVSRPRRLSRRNFLGVAPAAVGLVAAGGIGRALARSEATRLRGDDPDVLLPFERLHLPMLKLPAFTSNGAKVPVAVEMSHPMEPGHYIASISVVNERDPVPLKGVFHFTPLNGQVYLAFQIRLDHGAAEVSATAECSRHARWYSTRVVAIPEGAGGCAGIAPPPDRTGADEIGPPAIRIPQVIADGRISPDQIIDVQVKTKHPSRTGLVVRDGKFVEASDPLYLTGMNVFYGDAQVSRFTMTSALSDNPFIAFRLRAHSEDLLRVVLTNNRGRRFEAAHPIRFS